MAGDWNCRRLSFLRQRKGTELDEGSEAFRAEFNHQRVQCCTSIPQSLLGNRGEWILLSRGCLSNVYFRCFERSCLLCFGRKTWIFFAFQHHGMITQLLAWKFFIIRTCTI